MIAVATGSDFNSGFIGGFVGKTTGHYAQKYLPQNHATNLLITTSTAALTAHLTNGNPAQAAVQAAMVYVFNDAASMERDPESVGEANGNADRVLIAEISAGAGGSGGKDGKSGIVTLMIDSAGNMCYTRTTCDLNGIGVAVESGLSIGGSYSKYALSEGSNLYTGYNYFIGSPKKTFSLSWMTNQDSFTWNAGYKGYAAGILAGPQSCQVILDSCTKLW